MSNFDAKMHRIQFRLGLRAPDPAERAYSAPADSLVGFKGPSSKRGIGRGGKWVGVRCGGERGSGRKRTGPPRVVNISLYNGTENSLFTLSQWALEGSNKTTRE